MELIREIIMIHNYDVIVAGGGPAGCAAAISAAREGAKVLLVEAQYSLGGMSTVGMVPVFAPFTDGVNTCSAGICDELIGRYKEKYNYDVTGEWGWVTINHEIMKSVYDEFMLKYKVDVLFGTYICQAERVDNRINSVTVANKRGLTTYKAKMYIDSTGDGDLAFFAGAEFEKGDKDGKLQGSTLCFTISNINMEEFQKLPYLNAANPDSPIYDIINDDRFPMISDDHFCYTLSGDGVVTFNAGHIWGADSENTHDIANKIMLGRQKAICYRDALAEYFPKAFGKSVLVSTGAVLGTRESRRIMGDYILTTDDYLARRCFEDEIARACYYIDVHSSENDGLYKDKEHNNVTEYKPGESYGIPYRSLVAKGLDNLLCAGRIISCDRNVYGSIRVMPTCFTTGQAAGVAAAMATEAGVHIRDISIKELRQKLINYGAYIK